VNDVLDAGIGKWFQRACALQDHLPVVAPYATAAMVERLGSTDDRLLAVSGAALAWVHGGIDVPLLLLETAALVALDAPGAAGDVKSAADGLREVARIVSVWVDALDERVVDELRVEAADDAAAMSRVGLPADMTEEQFVAWAAQSRARDAKRSEEALERRRALIDVFGVDRQCRIAARLRELRSEVEALRSATPPEQS
jgi:hypothetical protein